MARKYKAATAKEVLAYMDGQKAYALGIEECPRLVIIMSLMETISAIAIGIICLLLVIGVLVDMRDV